MGIPKIVHYCWFGKGEMPSEITKNIETWRQYLPDYKFILWNEENFDVSYNQFTNEAYRVKKYAFVTDYVRLYVLNKYGGIYMDTDVEVLKNLDGFLLHRSFTGCENNNNCVTGIIASEPEHPWISDLLSYYDGKRFINDDGSYAILPNTTIITEITKEKYGWIPKNEYQILREDVNIYPFSVFCAKDWKSGKVLDSVETYTIHHFSGSWITRRDKIKRKVIQWLGPTISIKLASVKKSIKFGK